MRHTNELKRFIAAFMFIFLTVSAPFSAFAEGGGSDGGTGDGDALAATSEIFSNINPLDGSSHNSKLRVINELILESRVYNPDLFQALCRKYESHPACLGN